MLLGFLPSVPRHKLAGCQIRKLIHLQPLGEILGICRHLSDATRVVRDGAENIDGRSPGQCARRAQGSKYHTVPVAADCFWVSAISRTGMYEHEV